MTASTPRQNTLMEAVRHHQAGCLDEAERLYRRVLKTAPRNADALHLLGVVTHQRGDNGRARQLITKAIAVNDGDAAYHNNLGTVLLALDQAEPAAQSFRRALALNPSYPEAHNNLGNALQILGRPDEAVPCYRQAIALRPDYAEAHANLGRARRTLGDLDEAVDCYQRAVSLQPRYVKALKDLGDALGELGRPDDAEARYRQARDVNPRDPDVGAALAALWERASKLEDGLRQAESVLADTPDHLRAAVIAARCERRLGRPEAGRQRLQKLRLDRRDADSRAFAAYEMGAICDRLGDHAAAFGHFAEGNRLIMGTPQAKRYDCDALPRRIDTLRQRFTADWLGSWTPPVPYDGLPPAFLIGFPRSGTTLLDQVLDAHPGITTIEEKPLLDVVRGHVEERFGAYPAVLATMTADDVAAAREVYFTEAAKYVADPRAGLLIDKMPLNAIDAGLIRRLFPEAPILLALRHPCDVVLSGFMQAFKPNLAMIQFGTLESTARFYAQVMDLWRHYADLLPLRTLSVRYEDLVADFAAETRRILDFFGLPWDDAVLAYADHAKTRAISTPSYHQVVQPIYSRSVGRWHNYRSQFHPVLPLLHPAIQAFGYTTDDTPA
ncbi:MAG: sulfotransferase [Rhodospirillales bacterium]|nr:sulfotransferase [Rhodospirillales bacterium]